jgi:hypothetical protein
MLGHPGSCAIQLLCRICFGEFASFQTSIFAFVFTGFENTRDDEPVILQEILKKKIFFNCFPRHPNYYAATSQLSASYTVY